MLAPNILPEGQQIVFFDGVCGLCNHVVDFLLRISGGHPMKFAPLQGSTAQRLLGGASSDLDTIAYYRDGVIWLRSAAILAILTDCGGIWRVLSVLRFVPAPVRDGIYRCVAANRYKIFGKKDSCRMPSPSERERFLA